MGVWIEIVIVQDIWTTIYVTPFVGVWIEIYFSNIDLIPPFRHSLCGSVD